MGKTGLSLVLVRMVQRFLRLREGDRVKIALPITETINEGDRNRQYPKTSIHLD